MSRILIKGKQLQFDWGMNIILSKHTGKDALTPLVDLSHAEMMESLVYAGLARVDEEENRPVTHSIDQVRLLVKRFSGPDIAKLNTAWDTFLYVDTDAIEDNEPSQETPEKKKE